MFWPRPASDLAWFAEWENSTAGVLSTWRANVTSDSDLGRQRDAGTGVSGEGLRGILEDALSKETQSLASLPTGFPPHLPDLFGKQARHPALG
jgi:hypothetical protein